MLKTKDLRDMPSEELEAALQDCRKELFQMANDFRHSGKIDKPHLLRSKRRDIARLLTVLRQKQIAS